MSFNLIYDKWIPVRRQDAIQELIAPWELTDKLKSNPILALDAPRPDFNGALIQFLIGLVQTTMAPDNDRAWRKALTEPPEPRALNEAFESVSSAFNLDGDDPRFMQDLNFVNCEEKEISALLIEAPGGNTLRNNTDFFIKRGMAKSMCFSCAATALFALQTNAPSGGVGHRTSLRGGGPLTTLILGENLWETVWLNLLPRGDFIPHDRSSETNETPDIFPWLRATRTSEKGSGRVTTPVDVDPLQVFWGMPRRIRLTLESLGEGTCRICGRLVTRLVSKFLTKNYGVNYEGAWLHPLTPYSEIKGEPPNPRKGQPGGVHYRHWLGLVQADDEAGRMPARVVKKFWDRQSNWPELHDVFRRGPRLWAFAYDMDNMKARCWYESSMPLFFISDDIRAAYEEFVVRAVRIATLVASNVRRCVKQALFRRPSDVNGDLSIVDTQFWQGTERAFYSVLSECRTVASNANEVSRLKAQWLKTLTTVAERIFDQLSQTAQVEVVDSKRIALAARDLRRLNAPTNKKIREILDVPKKSK